MAHDRHWSGPGPQQPSNEHWGSHIKPSLLQSSSNLLFCSNVPCSWDFLILLQSTPWAKHKFLFSKIAMLPEWIFFSDLSPNDVSEVLTIYNEAKYSVSVLPPMISRFLRKNNYKLIILCSLNFIHINVFLTYEKSYEQLEQYLLINNTDRQDLHV